MTRTLLLLALSWSSLANAAPVVCRDVVFHWGGLYTESTGHTADSRLLISACTKFGDIQDNQMAARCVLGTRNLGEDCAGWGPIRDERGVRYDVWGSTLRNQAPRPQGDARPPMDRPPPAPGEVTGPVAMSDVDFANLLMAIEGKSFGDDKIELINLAANHAHFSCKQVGALMDLMTFGSEKVDVVKTLASRVVDKQNSFLLLDRVTFPSEQQEIKRLFQ